jgi:hypothetical protein
MIYQILFQHENGIVIDVIDSFLVKLFDMMKNTFTHRQDDLSQLESVSGLFLTPL